MMSLLTRFMTLPGPMRLLIVVLAGGVGLSSLRLFNVSTRMIFMLVIGLILVGFLVAGFRAFLKWRDKKKAVPMARGLTENAGAAPQAVSDPARRAKLDELRRTFEDGVQKFNAAGKNLYSMPWYVLVGEPGSGKTEAIRHCNVGFPPGMQDQLQGAGGTINMNWWFTNQAIIIDTAGRLMFEEVEAGGGGEWREFLKLLKSTRPNCPINGMLLVIPADSLIRDTADQIEQKAGKIARQFDDIQRALGVRFPVFVVISKCDLITGFREFFDLIDDPQLQHQMIGWSNPLPLDAPFEPAAVEEHFETVRERILRNRLWLLRDPVHSEDPEARRSDEVDALFAFPDALMKIVPRLRRYLEMVFVSGEWSPKPLFIRGIYFTSSLREGSALDAELAEALGVTVESLPTGPVWERDRAFFLRDLFLDKVFRERGLVTQATNVKGQQRKRTTILLGGGIAAALVFIGLTWWSSGKYQATMDNHRTLWASVDEGISLSDETYDVLYEQRRNKPLIKYKGYENIEGDFGEAVTIATLPGILLDRIQQSTPGNGVPAVFKVVDFISSSFQGLDGMVDDAYAELIEEKYLKPIVKVTRSRFANWDEPMVWNKTETNALEQLIRLRRIATGRPPATEEGQTFKVLPFYEFAKEDIAEIYKRADEDIETTDDDAQSMPPSYVEAAADLNLALEWIHGRADKRASTAPRDWQATAQELVEHDDVDLESAIDSGVDLFVKTWSGDDESAYGSDLRSFLALRRAAEDFQNAERKIQEVGTGYRESGDGITTDAADDAEVRGPWNTAYKELNDAYETLRVTYDQVYAVAGGVDLRNACADAVAAEKDGGTTAYAQLLAGARPEGGTGELDKEDPLFGWYSALQEGQKLFGTRFDEKTGSLVTALTALQTSDFLVDRDRQPRFAARFAMYTTTHEVMGGNTEVDRLVDVGAAMATITDAHGEASARIDDASRNAELGSALAGAKTICEFMISHSLRFRRWKAIDNAIEKAPATSADLANWASAQVPEGDGLHFPSIPFTTLKSNPVETRFHPEGASRLFESWMEIESVLTPDSGPNLQVLDAAVLKEDFDALRAQIYEPYVEDYLRYWTKTVAGYAEPQRFTGGWESCVDDLDSLEPGEVIRSLLELNTMINDAIDNLDIARTEDARLTLKKEREILEDSAFDDKCEEALRSWTSARRTREARRAIEDIRPDEFRSDYLTAYGKVRYWDLVFEYALESLAQDVAAQVGVERDLLLEFDSFPLCLDSNEVMSWEEVVQAARAAEAIQSAESGATGVAGDGELIRHRNYDKIPVELTPLLDTLIGRSTLRNSGDRKWFSQIKPILDALVDLDDAPKIRASVAFPGRVDAKERDSRTGQLFNRFRRVAVNGTKFSSTAGSPDGTAEVAIGSTDSLKVGYIRQNNDNEAPAASISRSARWELLREILDHADSGPIDSCTILLEFTEGGTTYYHLIDLRLNSALPARDQWPTLESWPVWN